jgi:hypothetical protein
MIELNPYVICVGDLPRFLPKDVIFQRACPECEGEGTADCCTCYGSGYTSCGAVCCDEAHECVACDSEGKVTCAACRGTGGGLAVRRALAAEATRLWKRDVGRGIIHGTKDLYIRFAIESLRDGEIGVEAA